MIGYDMSGWNDGNRDGEYAADTLVQSNPVLASAQQQEVDRLQRLLALSEGMEGYKDRTAAIRKCIAEIEER